MTNERLPRAALRKRFAAAKPAIRRALPSLLVGMIFTLWLLWQWTFLHDAATPPFVGLGGVALLLYVHELGHVVAERRLGASARAGLIPCGLLFWTASRDARTEAWVGIAGPIAGAAASYLAIGLYELTGYATLLLIGFISLALNAISVLPVPPLDGGRAAAAITPWLWIPGLAGLAALVWWAPSFIGWMALGAGALSVISRLRKRNQCGTYYQVARGPRLALIAAYGATWVAIIGGIAWCMVLSVDALHRFH